LNLSIGKSDDQCGEVIIDHTDTGVLLLSLQTVR